MKGKNYIFFFYLKALVASSFSLFYFVYFWFRLVDSLFLFVFSYSPLSKLASHWLTRFRVTGFTKLLRFFPRSHFQSDTEKTFTHSSSFRFSCLLVQNQANIIWYISHMLHAGGIDYQRVARHLVGKKKRKKKVTYNPCLKCIQIFFTAVWDKRGEEKNKKRNRREEEKNREKVLTALASSSRSMGGGGWRWCSIVARSWPSSSLFFFLFSRSPTCRLARPLDATIHSWKKYVRRRR
jgi:hypothetical protein